VPACPFGVIRVEFVMFVNVRFQGDFGHSDIGWWLYAARDSRLCPVML
jgi:hypothetical protein